MFMGTYYNSIDAKNRMIVPSRHRDELGRSCVLTKGLDKCLYIYTISDWEAQVSKIEKLPESDPEVREFIRHLFSNAVECEFDKQGRIIIPPNLKEFAGIDQKLVTVGVMKKIEIWSKEIWEGPAEGRLAETKEFHDSLSKYGF